MKLAPSLFVVLLGLLTGWLASTGAEAALAGPPRLEPASGPPSADDADVRLSSARLGALLALRGERTSATDDTPATPEPPRLAGTLAPTFAAVVDERGRMQTLGVGALLGELELVAIEHFAVTWRHHGRLLHADVRASSSDGSLPRPPPVTLSRRAVRESLARLPEIARGVQFVPDFSGPAGATGRAFRGYRLERLEPTSVLASAGLLRGDVLQRINGLDLSRAEHLGQLLSAAPTATRVEIDLERQGQAVHLSVELSP
jgi:hypothetical protein